MRIWRIYGLNTRYVETFVNQQLKGTFQFNAQVSNIDTFHHETRWKYSGYNYYTDALSYSWDPNYNIGNNLNQGLLLSYTNNTELSWIGYSLDGQANKTISGNKTIPIPSLGLHKIQVFGNNQEDNVSIDKTIFHYRYTKS